MSDPRYPIGRYAPDSSPTPATRANQIHEIENLPSSFRQAIKGLSPEQLETPYRDGGWTVRQVVHHVPDSHMNSYIRFRFALSENEPTIKPYDEAIWAQLIDARTAPIEASLKLLEGLHERWT